MSSLHTNICPVACPDPDDEFVGLVAEVKAQVAAGVSRAAAFKSRSGADIKRDFASRASSAVLQFGGEVNGDSGTNQPWRQVRTLADLPDDEVEALYEIAVYYVHQACQLLTSFGRSVTQMHQRYLRALESEHAGTNDPGETQAMERALGLALTLHRQVCDAFECLVSTCEVDLLHIHELAFRLERLTTELQLYGRDLPQAIERAKFELDYDLLGMGVVAFRAAGALTLREAREAPSFGDSTPNRAYAQSGVVG